MWIWFGTSTCGPNYDYVARSNYLVGELSGGAQGLQFDGQCTTGVGVDLVYQQGTCGSTPTRVASLNSGIGDCNGLIFDSAVGGHLIASDCSYPFCSLVLPCAPF